MPPTNLRLREEALREERTELLAEADALVGRAERTDEDRARFGEVEARVKTVDQDLEDIARTREWERTQARAVSGGDTFTVGDGPIHTRPAHGMNGPYASIGEQAMDVYRVAVSGDGAARERLVNGAAHGLQALGIQAASGQSVAIDSEGGFLVQTDFSPAIWQLMHDQGKILSRVTPLPLTPPANAIEWPGVDETSRATGSRWGGITAYHVEEGVAPTASKQTYFRVALKLKKIAALVYATEEMLAHVPLMSQLLTQGMADELQFIIEDDIFEGNGAGKPFGIINAAAKIEIAKETGQAADTIVHDNLKKMWARLHARSRANAVWYINQDAEPTLDDLAKVIGTAGVEPNYVTYGPDGVLRIKGRPVETIEYAATVGDAGDIVLADLSQYAFITSAVNQAASMHFKFDTDEQTFRTTVRVDGALRWKSALTPFKGTATQSPVITLAARA